MKPKDAARIFNTLDMNITVALLKGMKPSSSSAILSQMNSEKAKAVTSELIGNNI
ncbi:MAG: MotE family protein [Alphaproteobacteria bacterium]